MTGEQDGDSKGVSGVGHELVFARIREQLAELESSIESLRDDGADLLESAAKRTAMAVLDPPTVSDEALRDLEDSLAALGRQAAAGADETSKSDLGDTETEDAISGAFDALAAAPAFASPADLDGKIPPVDVEVKRRALLDQKALPPVFGAAVVEDAGVDGESSESATVLEFPARANPPTEAAAVAEQSPEDAESVFGAMPTEAPDQGLAASTAEPEAGADGEAVDSDGLDAIAESSSTDIPADWNQSREGEDAFDKFFSADVEPEPAQRWLLSD